MDRATRLTNQLSQEPRFKDQVAVITGGAGGIGFAIAERLGSEGASIVLLDLKEQPLQNAVAKLSSLRIASSYHAVDVTDLSAVANTFSRVYSKFGRLDVLVQSAGITGMTGLKTHEVPPENFEQVMRINTFGIFNCCKEALPIMLKRNYGRILNIASIAGKEGNAGMMSYSTSKGAVIAATKSMGKEYAETGITVNCIAPAVVRTEMVAKMPDHQVKYMTDKIPMKRCGKLEEIASLVAFIVSKEAAFCTGFCFDASGGRATY